MWADIEVLENSASALRALAVELQTSINDPKLLPGDEEWSAKAAAVYNLGVTAMVSDLRQSLTELEQFNYNFYTHIEEVKQSKEFWDWILGKSETTSASTDTASSATN
ncbi:MAG: hypothetical protein LBC43_04960 [Bifidobacteriaceae bacterium]|jgi:hypothetical protein|nr:hypothetical protein [Bifidobacteriaceae bacterium]